MDIQIKPEFFDSIKKMKVRNSKLYRFYSFFRYDLKRFFKNFWYFRKHLWEFRSWDYGYNLQLFAASLERTANFVEVHGMEIDESRLKKVAKMRRAAEIMKNVSERDYLELAEKESGTELILRNWNFKPIDDKLDEDGKPYYEMISDESDDDKEHNRKIYRLSEEIEKREWNELISILKGQDDYNHEIHGDFYKYFDGSGIKCWWD
jgi:hypothetical protein